MLILYYSIYLKEFLAFKGLCCGYPQHDPSTAVGLFSSKAVSWLFHNPLFSIFLWFNAIRWNRKVLEDDSSSSWSPRFFRVFLRDKEYLCCQYNMQARVRFTYRDVKFDNKPFSNYVNGFMLLSHHIVYLCK